jgi:beta-glucosidase
LVEVTFAQGSPVTTRPGSAAWSRQDNETRRPIEELQAEAVAQAKGADLIIYVGGLTPAQEGEGFDRDSIELPEVQENLMKALFATGKRMVMVNCSGSAIALTWQDQNLPAILQAWYPGQAGGQAVAEALFGEVNPSGHLPITFYRATSDLPPLTDYSMSNRTYRYFGGEPLYAFGHGLSYTTFDYQGGKLDANQTTPEGAVTVTFTVKNSGPRDGDDVAQVYFRHKDSKVPQPKLALCGFRRVSLKSGEAAEITIEVPAVRMRHWDSEQMQYVVEPGEYELLVGKASDDIALTLPLTIFAP